MLVLTRKAEEKIVIGKGPDQIVITILRIQGDKVSVGVTAKKETPVYREELLSKGTKRPARKECKEFDSEYETELSASAQEGLPCDANKDGW